jgi:thiol-disulfide isomerase/thioredoxin
VAALSVACGHGGAGDSGSTSPLVLTSPRAVNATTAPLLPTSRFALPELDYPGFQALMSQLRGTPVVVAVWGAWCGPCRREAPTLARVAGRFGHRVQFVGVDVGDVSRVQAQAFIRDFALPYPSVYDPQKQILSGLGFIGPPITMVFDRAGKRVNLISGPLLSAGELARAIARVA